MAACPRCKSADRVLYHCAYAHKQVGPPSFPILVDYEIDEHVPTQCQIKTRICKECIQNLGGALICCECGYRRRKMIMFSSVGVAQVDCYECIGGLFD